MLSPPPVQDVRPSGNRHGFVQGGEEIGVIHRALNTASLWKLYKKRKTDQYQYRRMR